MNKRINRRTFLKISVIYLAGGILASCNSSGNEPAVVETPPATNPTSSSVIKINVLANGLDFPEGPVFDSQGNLWCTEIGGGNLVRWSEEGFERIPTQGRPNGLAGDAQGRLWMCDSGQNAIRRYDPASDTWETLVDQLAGKPLQSPNDLCFDILGNLLFTCPNFADERPTGYACCLGLDGKLVQIAEGFYRPNGLDFVEGGKSLVLADTYQKTLFKGGWNVETQTWEDPKTWSVVGGSEGPDGMVPGADGLLYVAIYGDGVIRVVDEKGKIVRTISLPGANPTNVAIDPSGKLGLVVTEAEKGQLLSLPEIQPGIVVAGDYLFNGGL